LIRYISSILVAHDHSASGRHDGDMLRDLNVDAAINGYLYLGGTSRAVQNETVL
jgi:hypothetical protein